MNVRALTDLDLAAPSATGRVMNVCVVSSEILGPIKNGGIATATSALIKQLASDGHKVTVLYTFVGNGKPVAGDKPWQYWVDQLATEGIVLDFIPHEGDYRAWREASWLVKDYLGQGKFDLVYFNDHFGSGYYAQLAKRSGLAPFSDQLHCIITHGSMEWVYAINDQFAKRVADVEWMGLERRSVEMADVIIAPSTYLLREYEKYGWRLPLQTFHQPYPILGNPVKVDQEQPCQVSELVFFGRLEARKGLWIFCEALDRLAKRIPRTDVTFLGKVTEFSGISTGLQIVNRSRNWPFRIRLLTNFDQQQAVSYLRVPGKLAVMPSIADNSPCVVYECMEAGIPFVTTLGSGADELVDPSCWPDMMVEPNVEALTERLAQALEKGARLGRPRFNPAENLETWSAWHRYVAANASELIQRASAGQIASTAAKSQKAALIVVVDNGNCALSVLIDNLSSHMTRFGDQAAYLILTTRRGELQEVLFEIFSAGPDAPPPPLCILDARAIDEAQHLISASAFVFFVDAEVEILSPFFLSALNILQQQQPSIVSCAVATRRSKDENGEIADLPCGELPGLSALGRPIGSSAWAVTAAALVDEMSKLELYDRQLDVLIPSLTLGQLLMEKCSANGLPIHLFPIVGAIETRDRDFARVRTLNDARLSASALGIVPSVYAGEASWYSISSYGEHIIRPANARVDCSAFLSPKHPLPLLEEKLDSPTSERIDLSQLAAAMGRAELALQLEAGKGPSAGMARHLTDVATRATRHRPAWDLVDILNGGSVFLFGLKPSPEAVEARKVGSRSRKLKEPRKTERMLAPQRMGVSALTNANHADLEIGRFYVDGRRLSVKRNKIQATASLRTGGPGRLFVFDIPLCGNSTLSARLRAGSSSDATFVRLKLIDQRMGEEMGIATVRLAAGKSGELSIPLHEVYGRVALCLEFSGAERMEVSIEKMEVK